MKKIVIFVVIGFVICCGIFSVIYTQFLRNSLHDVVYKGRIKMLEDILPPDKLKKLTPIELRILRNTIYAKHGYNFTSTDLLAHFSQFDWYINESDDVDSKLSEIDKLNITIIQYYEKNFPTVTKRRKISLENLFRNKLPVISTIKTVEPFFEVEMVIGNQYFNKTFKKYIMNDNTSPFSIIQSMITDSNIKQDEINNIFVGFNSENSDDDYIIVISIKNKTFSFNNNFKNFNIQKDRYNNDISFINYNGKQYYLSLLSGLAL